VTKARDPDPLRAAITRIWQARNAPPDSFFGEAFPAQGGVFVRYDPVVLDPPRGGRVRREIAPCYSLDELRSAQNAVLEWADSMWNRWLMWRSYRSGQKVELADVVMEIVHVP